jgi:phage terminase Nu1 subunit (DNA packaging protein)
MTSAPEPEFDVVLRHDLAPGGEDGVLNRTNLARALATSQNTISDWVGKGMPYLSEGKNGHAWQFHLSACWQWLQEVRGDERRRQEDADRIAAQAAQSFLNLDADEDFEMTPRYLREISEAEWHRNRVAEQRGDLVRAERVRAVLEQIFTSVQRGLVTLPDFAERELSLDRAAAATLERRCMSVLREIRQDIEAQIDRPGEVVNGPGAQRTMDL